MNKQPYLDGKMEQVDYREEAAYVSRKLKFRQCLRWNLY
jgi:hypothetical protein